MSKQQKPVKPGEILDPLFKALADSGARMVWGIQPDQMKRIEEERTKRNAIDIGSTEFYDAIYSNYFWRDLAKEFGWDALTLALFYFEKQSKPTQ